MPSFDEQSCKRIAKSTLWVERHIAPSRNQALSYRPGNDGFFAVIKDYKGNDASNGANAYSWVALQPGSDGTWGPNSEWGHGEWNGAEPGNIIARCLDGSANVIWGDYVWLSPATGQDFYVFQYNGGGRIVTYVGSDEATVIGSSPIQTIPVINSTDADIPDGDILVVYADGDWVIAEFPCM